jgi:hypothetical protein
MKPVLIQSLLHHKQKRKALNEQNIDHSHGGRKDRSGFIVLLLIIVSMIVALAIS